jgi:hypothetical protein
MALEQWDGDAGIVSGEMGYRRDVSLCISSCIYTSSL